MKTQTENYNLSDLKKAFEQGGKSGYNSARGKDFLTFQDFMEILDFEKEISKCTEKEKIKILLWSIEHLINPELTAKGFDNPYQFDEAINTIKLFFNHAGYNREFVKELFYNIKKGK